MNNEKNDLKKSVDMVESAGYSYDAEKNDVLRKASADEYNMNPYAQMIEKPIVPKEEAAQYCKAVDMAEAPPVEEK